MPPEHQEMSIEPTAVVLCDSSSSSGGNTSDPASGRSFRHQFVSEPELGQNLKSFSRLCSRDEAERGAALEELTLGVLACSGMDRPGSARLDKQTLLNLLRVSLSCPLPKVRERAAELLRTAQVMSPTCPFPCIIHDQRQVET